MSTLYRAATYEDRVTIAALHADSWRVTYRGVYRDEFLDRDVLQDRIGVWEGRLSAPLENQFVVVAEEEGHLVGFACAYGRDDERWGTLLDNIHVRRERHRQGTGPRLVSVVAREGSAMSQASGRQAKRDYVPAAPQLWLYDFLVAVLARESRWRPALLTQIAPSAKDSIADIGCGTGSLLALISSATRPAALIG